MRAEEIIDEDDWIEVEKVEKTAPVLADVTVKVTVAATGRHRHAAAYKARTYLAFRGAAADWIVEHGPRFRVSIGGNKCNYVRIVPDAKSGKFEWGEAVGGKTKRMNLGTLTAWPKEERPATPAVWEVSAGYMKLRLPDDFAVARGTDAPLPPGVKTLGDVLARVGKNAESAPRTVRIDEVTTARVATTRMEPKSVKAQPDIGMSRPTAARSVNVVAMAGEPEPGRSALAQRR